LNKAVDDGENIGIHLIRASSLEDMVASFDTGKNGPRVFVMSLPHGPAVDKVLDELLPLLSPGDIVIDGGNEWWEETERRQGKCVNRNVHYVGTGVSGGYQSSRHGPSISPSGTTEAYAKVEEKLKKWAAKDGKGNPCVCYVGPGGSGHYVKMIHNGIEQGHLSILAEAHYLLHHTAGLENKAVADLFDEWNGTNAKGGEDEKAGEGKEGKELYDNFLLKIGAEILRFRHGDGLDMKKGIVDGIEDKVTQDVDNSEGTGVWTLREIAGRHVAAPTIAAAHQLRITSAFRRTRLKAHEALDLPLPKRLGDDKSFDQKEFLKDLRLAVYAGILGSYVQGMHIIAQASEDQHWNINYANVIGIWRAGCIIQSDGISDILQPIYTENPKLKNLLENPKIAQELRKSYDALKRVCKISLESDSITPALDATLSWLKQAGCDSLPTNFEEAELDYFGDHQYDTKDEAALDPKKGKHHTEWKST